MTCPTLGANSAGYSALADWAEEGGSLCLDDADDIGFSALRAGLSRPLIYPVQHLEPTRPVPPDAVRAVAER